MQNSGENSVVKTRIIWKKENSISLIKKNFGLMQDGTPINLFVIKNSNGVKFFYSSKDGEESYPGKLDVEVTYLLTDDNELQIEYKANTNKSTPINFTNHSYSNPSGVFSKSIINHDLKINSNKFLETDSESIPTGNIINVDSTPFDFWRHEKISRRNAIKKIRKE